MMPVLNYDKDERMMPDPDAVQQCDKCGAVKPGRALWYAYEDGCIGVLCDRCAVETGAGTEKSDRHQRAALRTWYQPAHVLHWDKLPAILGLVGEAGELADEIKKAKYKPGYATDIERMRGELVDVWYYVRILAYQLGMDTDEMTERSAAKLHGGKHGWEDHGEGAGDEAQ